jgi:hypothetical protein
MVLSGSVWSQRDTLLFENFNDCTKPTGWEVTIEGNPNAVWYVGTPQNSESDGSSIDGTCMVIIDDDATGNNTDPFVWTMTSPYFDAGGYTKVKFTADVHMRNAGETFTIYLEDERGRRVLRTFEGRNFSGTQFSQFVRVDLDLTFLRPQSARLVFEYNDNAKWAWWAGFDNVLITAEGSGELLILEDFNSCELPSGWDSIVESGDHSWQIGRVTNSNAGTNVSMNGSCFIYFDDDGNGEQAPPSKVTLISPEFDGIAYAKYALSFDLIYRTYSDNEYLEVGVLSSKGFHPVQIISRQVGGNAFTVFQEIQLDLSAYKDEQLRIYFRYDDGSRWNWWVGIDNVKVIGKGTINDFCIKAIPLIVDECMVFNTTEAFAAQDVPMQCNTTPASTLWYSFEHTGSQFGKIAITQSNFNDVVEIFKGDHCAQLQPIVCQDRDEYGFRGEVVTSQLTSGKYYVRISGLQNEFGKDKGEGCITYTIAPSGINPASHARCNQAATIAAIDDCMPIHNIWAENPEVAPSRNTRARADVWLSFTPEEIGDWMVHTGADFSDMITVYSGTCGDLTEIASNEQGLELLLTDLSVGTPYFIQWSGYFSTLEGKACIKIEPVERTSAPEDCTEAILTDTGKSPGISNMGSGFSGIAPACDPLADADIWYQFIPDRNGPIYVRNTSDFISTMAIYKGQCDQLQSIFCDRTTHACEGYTRVNNLEAGKTYFVQIASRGRVPGMNRGSASFEWLYPSEYQPYQTVSLQTSSICVSKNAALILPEATGGHAPYFFVGNAIEDAVLSLSDYFVEVTDADGCVDFRKGTAPDCSEADCNVFFDIKAHDISCFGANDGFATIVAEGGVGPYHALLGDDSYTHTIENLPPGDYTVTLSDAGGCQETIQFSIQSPSPILYEVIAIDPSTGNDGIIHLQIQGGQAPYQVSWFYNGQATNLTGASLTDLAPGIYRAIISDANGCVFEGEDIEVEMSTSTIDPGIIAGFTYYPNPANEWLQLSFKGNFSGLWRVQVIDRSGKVVGEDQITLIKGGKFDLHVSQLPSGLYLLQLLQDEVAHVVKFIKQ